MLIANLAIILLAVGCKRLRPGILFGTLFGSLIGAFALLAGFSGFLALSS